MFHMRATSPAEWRITSNNSLFSIQLAHSDDVVVLYSKLYYDVEGEEAGGGGARLRGLGEGGEEAAGGRAQRVQREEEAVGEGEKGRR